MCKERDFVPEMVFLLGRMGNSKEALMLIINRLGDVQRVRPPVSLAGLLEILRVLTRALAIAAGHRVRARAG